MPSPSAPDASARFRVVFSILCYEAVLATLYETWVGPVYISGLAGESGVGLALVSVLAALPGIGASGHLLGAWAFSRADSVKRYTLTAAAAARAVWILPLALAGFWAYRSSRGGPPFPVQGWFHVLAACACVSALFASASVAAWMHWMKQLVPARFQGRFFGYRQRFVVLALILANGSAAALIDWRTDGLRIGAAALCAAAIACGLLSILLHARVPDVPAPSRFFHRPGLGELIGTPLKDASFRRLLAFGATFHFSVQLAGPYFAYYFTKEVSLGMSTIALWTGLTNAGCLISVAFWGRRTDRGGGASRRQLFLTANAISLSPLIYFLAPAHALPWIGPADYFLSGVASSGFALAQTSLILRSAPAARIASYFSVYTAACGIVGALGTLLGGNLIRWLAPHGYSGLWLISFVARAASVWLLCLPLFRQKWVKLSHAQAPAAEVATMA